MSGVGAEEEEDSTRYGEEFPLRGDTEPSEVAEDGDVNESDASDADTASESPTTPNDRWAFMTDYIECWFQSLKYKDSLVSTEANPRFDSFLVHVARPLPGHQSDLELLHATELVAYMLMLDKTTWWYAKRRFRPWLEAYDPSQYDPNELVPKMTFAMGPMIRDGDDPNDAVTQLHEMLMGTHLDIESKAYAAYAATKQRLFQEEDVHAQLRGFQIPTAIQFQPREPAKAEELRSYLRDAATLVRAFKHKCNDATTPFRLDDVVVNVYLVHLGDVHTELRELLSLGVPVTISLRPESEGRFTGVTEWTGFDCSNWFPALAHDPGQGGSTSARDVVGHTVNSRWISSSTELWSAIAYSSSVSKVHVQPHQYDNAEYDTQIARWMGYALAHSSTLRTLEISAFQMTAAEVDALEAVLAMPKPARLLPEASTSQSERVQLVRLKSGTILECKPGGLINGHGDEWLRKPTQSMTLAELHIPADWRFPFVATDEVTAKLQLIVPGHAICEVPLNSVASTVELPPHDEFQLGSKLTALALHSGERTDVVGRFVGLVGRNLKELRWYGDEHVAENRRELHDDVQHIAVACPTLETIVIQYASIQSLASLGSLGLCELTLINTFMPMPALIALFSTLRDNSVRIARTLQRFTYHSQNDPLSQQGVDAAICMLATNRNLHKITLCVEEAVIDANLVRFEAAQSVLVTVARLPLTAKWAFLSVIHDYRMQRPCHALGQLDSECTASIFQWFRRESMRVVKLMTV